MNGTDELASVFWWHSIRLSDGRVTPGAKTIDCLNREFNLTFGPLNLTGKSVLDAGAWNGAFSVEAHRRGASRVVGLDHATWNNPELHGRASFEMAARLCNAPLEAVDQDLDAPQLSLRHLGKFDVVLFLGVFYHLVDPIAALRELASIANEALVLETHLEKTSSENVPSMVFYPTNELNGDGSNWWGPNRLAVEKLLNLFGFPKVVYTDGSDPARGVFHAYR